MDMNLMKKGAERFLKEKENVKLSVKNNMQVLQELGIPEENILGNLHIMGVNFKDAEKDFYAFFEVTYLKEHGDDTKWYQPFGKLYLPSGLETEMFLTMYSDKFQKVGNIIFIMRVEGKLSLEIEKEGDGFSSL